MKRKAGIWIIGGIALSLATTTTAADISYAQKITVEAAGGMSMFASEGDVITQISRDRARTDTTTKMKSKLMGMFGSGSTGSIIRLDKALTWNLLLDKKQYTETTFAEARAQLEKSVQAMKDAQGRDEALH